MSGNKIRILATNGEDTREVGFINVSYNDITYGQVTSDNGGDVQHYTYHENGYIHKKDEPNSTETSTRPRFYGPDLSDFEGYVILGQGGTPPSPEVGKLISAEFHSDEESGYDSIIHVDSRNAEFGISWNVFLCEPGFRVLSVVSDTMDSNAELMERLDKEGEPGFTVHTYTGTEPWVGVIAAPSERLRTLPLASEHFRAMGHHRVPSNNEDETCPNEERRCDGPNGDGPLCYECYEQFLR
jgi:hypothetical protein